MTAWLLDTNVISELRRPRPEPKVVAFIADKPLDLLFVSSVTLAEIRFGIELVTDPGKRAELNAWLAHKVRPMFEQRVLTVSEDVLFNGVSWSRTDARPVILIRSRTSSLPRPRSIMG
jgi:toxin FitB